MERSPSDNKNTIVAERTSLDVETKRRLRLSKDCSRQGVARRIGTVSILCCLTGEDEFVLISNVDESRCSAATIEGFENHVKDGGQLALKDAGQFLVTWSRRCVASSGLRTFPATVS